MSELKPCELIHIFEHSRLVSDNFTEEAVAAAYIAALAALHDQPSNEPLTLDELRGMDGEPVWIKDGIGEGWFVTGAIVGTKLYFYEKSITVGEPLSGCGKTWLAYRRKPEGSENDGKGKK